VKTGAIIGIVVGATIVIVVGLIAYSYTQIQISLDDISFAGIDWAEASLSTLVKLGLNVLTGNWLGAALSLVQGIKLNLIFGLTNHGFFPVYIPDLTYDLSINGVDVGQGKSNVDLTINPGETKSLPVLQHVLIDSLKPAVSSIAESGGIMDLKVSGTAYFKLLGLTIPIPFESTKQISIIDEIKKHFTGSSDQQSNSYQYLTQTYVTLQASSYQISEGQTMTFSGRLTDSNGNGIPNQVVYVKRDITFSPDSTLGTGYTDSNGYFSADWVATKPLTSNTANVYATFDGSSGYSSVRGSDISIQVYAYQTTQSNQNPSSSDQQLQQANQGLQAVKTNPNPSQSVTITNSVYKVGPGEYQPISFTTMCTGTLSGNFAAQAALGDNIIVYVLDQNGYNQFGSGQSASTYYNSGKVASGSFSILLNPGTYYIVLSNSYSTFSTKTVSIQAYYSCN
jgi:LEA14-like dessication related protein